MPNKLKVKKATFAGGCFWCMVQPFKALDGVKDVTVGYTGGSKANPSYEDVSYGTTGHYEAVEIEYDPSLVTYQKLLDTFWMQIDPEDEGGQFADRGSQYRTAIFYHDDEQKNIAQRSKNRLSGCAGKIATEIRPASPFYPAEAYHQDYYKKNPMKYKLYKNASGREDYIRTREPLKVPGAGLTPLQFEVTQNNATERPFDNEYWNNAEEGIYVDLVSGEPLFSSNDKFESGTGWPSFTKPLEPGNIATRKDGLRVEVRSRHGDSHLGHVFDDGPAPYGTRFCINSAALRFIPKDMLEKQGYGKYSSFFESVKAEQESAAARQRPDDLTSEA